LLVINSALNLKAFSEDSMSSIEVMNLFIFFLDVS